MNIVNIEPNTPEWLEWRKRFGYYSASEAGAVMGESHFFPRSPYELFLVHTGEKEVFYSDAMRDGHKYESQIVQFAGDELGFDFKPVCVEKGEYMASLDGLAFDDNNNPIVLEAKTTTHNSPIWNNGAEVYKWQLTHQAIVCGVRSIWLCIYAKDIDAYSLQKVEIVDSDKTKLMQAWEKYGECMRNFQPPEMIKGIDYVENTSAVWQDLAEQYQALLQEKAETEKRLANIKTEIIKLANGRKTKGAGINCFPVTRKGSIQYNKIPELKNIDLEKYRGKASEYWVIK